MDYSVIKSSHTKDEAINGGTALKWEKTFVNLNKEANTLKTQETQSSSRKAINLKLSRETPTGP